ncbi:AfsR/SARP family transcriptional regulator [Nonomuraea sediminis]|uniref:AfsR/SARP family transcriptional regulator n=1 Tax=Nonomuraea sediminis TaxID=2835864 RepID=UPI001BDC3D33|nr:BTAD domain-containing putative transcriptional regulator [Nonomuraea sediminis]
MSSDDVTFQVLGPWKVRLGERLVTIPPGQLRVVLVSLLLSADEPVSVATIADRLWPERLPDSPRSAVHTYVTRLRKLLGRHLILTAPEGGYLIRVPPDQVDVHRFRDSLSRAGGARDELELLRAGLRLWHERPFSGVSATWLDHEVIPQLTEEWFRATERRIDLELAQGPPGGSVPELWELANRYPTREGLWLRLISALHEAGRRSDALDAFHRIRAVLSEELGIDPSARLLQLHRTILLGGATAGEQPRPRQLPHDMVTFNGRHEELAQLDATLGTGTEASPVIVTIDGAPGTGKTTLALHWAHRIAPRFPDVQLYLNLRGYGPGAAMSPATAAETLLRSLGVESALIPSGIEERSALLRTALADRPALILLDNARDADQVRPLLPGTSGLVIVTSRNQLRSLSIRDGAHRVTLGPLSEEQGAALLTATIGPDKAASDPGAVIKLVNLCDSLPLAIAIVAERVLRTPTVTEVVEALEDEKARLSGDGPLGDLRAALAGSYTALSADAAAMFRMLGQHPVGEIGLETAAALADVPIVRARESLDQLVAVHLLEQRRPHRYELHDLIRLYAVDLADPADTFARRRLLDWYLFAAVNADRTLHPNRRRDFVAPYESRTPVPFLADAAAALTWFEREYECLRAVIGWAAANGWAGYAWRTTMAMTSFLDARIPWRDGLDLLEHAVRAARAADEPAGEAYTLNSVGCIHLDKGENDLALGYFHRALEKFRQVRHERGETMMLGNISLVHAEAGHHEEAYRYATLALARCERLGYTRGRAINLDNLGVAYTINGEYEKALSCLHEAQAIYTELGERAAMAECLRHTARAHRAMGDIARSIRCMREAVTLNRSLRNRRWEALDLAELGQILVQAGHPGLARDVTNAGYLIMAELADPRAQEIKAARDQITVGRAR